MTSPPPHTGSFPGPSLSPGSYPPPPAGPGLGLAAIIMAVAALLISVTADLVFMAQAGSEFRTLQQQHWEAGESSSEDMALLGATAGAGVFLAVLQILSTMIGIVGLILGIVATVRGSFRSAAVTAIVVAGAAPIISFIVFSLILEAP